MDSANHDEKHTLHFFPHLQGRRRRRIIPEGGYSSSTNIERKMIENNQKSSKKGKSNEKSKSRKQKIDYSESNHLPNTGFAHPEDNIIRNQIFYSESDLARPKSHLQDLDQFVPDKYYKNYYGQQTESYPYPQDYPTPLQAYQEHPMTSTPFPRNSFAMLKRDSYGSGIINPFQHPQPTSAVKHQTFYRHPGILDPPITYYDYTQYEPQRKTQDYEHGYKYQNQNPDSKFDPQRRSYQYPKIDADQIYDHYERNHPYHVRGIQGWPYCHRSKGKKYTHIRTDNRISPSVEVQRSQPFTSTLHNMKEEDGLSYITDDNFTELEKLRGDDLGVIKTQPFQHLNNIPKLDAGHEQFWDSPITMMSPGPGFDPDMDICHLRYNRGTDMAEVPKSINHSCMRNFEFPIKGPQKGINQHTVTSKSMEDTEIKNCLPLDKKMLKTHQKLTYPTQKHCTGNRVHDHQLRCLDKVAQWISTLDVMPTLSSTTSGIDMEHFDAFESPDVTPDHIVAEPKVCKKPELQCHNTTDTNDKIERDLADNEEKERETEAQCHQKMLTDINDEQERELADDEEQDREMESECHQKKLTDINSSIETHMAENKVKGQETDIQCHLFSPLNINDKTATEIFNAKGDVEDGEIFPEVDVSQICTITDSQSDPGIQLESTVKEDIKKIEDNVTPGKEKQEELPSTENKETIQNEGTTATSDVSGPKHRNNPIEIDDTETSIFEELNFIYYQGETKSHIASDDSSCDNQPDTDFILKALTSPWKETGVSLSPAPAVPTCCTSQQNNQQEKKTLDDACSSFKSPSNVDQHYSDDSVPQKGPVEFPAAEASVGSFQQENLIDDSVTVSSGDTPFQENDSAVRTNKEPCSSVESKPNTLMHHTEEESYTTISEPNMTQSNESCLQDDKDVGSIESKLPEACSLTESQDITITNQEMDLSSIGSDASTLSTLHYSGVTTESLVQATQNADMINMEAVETDKTLTLNSAEHIEQENGEVFESRDPAKTVEAPSTHSALSNTSTVTDNHVEALDSMSVPLHQESTKTCIHDSLNALSAKDIPGGDKSTPDENLLGSEERASKQLPEKKKSTLKKKTCRVRKSNARRKPAYSRKRRKISSYRNLKHQKKNGQKTENSVHIELDSGCNWTAEISESPLQDNVQDNINQSDNTGITLAVSPKLKLNICNEKLITDKKNDQESNPDANPDANCDVPNSSEKQELKVNPMNLRSRSRSEKIQQSSNGALNRAGSSSNSKSMIISVQRKTAEQVKNDSTTIIKCSKSRSTVSKGLKTSPKNLRKRNVKASVSNTTVHHAATSSSDLNNKNPISLPTCNVKPILKTIERSGVTHKQRSKAKVAVKTTKSKSVAFMTSFNPKEETERGNRRKKCCIAVKGNPVQTTKGKTSSLKTSSEMKPESKGISKKISKTQPKKTQKTSNPRRKSRKMQPQVNLNEKIMLGSSKEDIVIPCSVDVKHFNTAESKTKKQKAIGSNNLDDIVPKQKKVSKTSNMSQRFVARPWRSENISENSQETNLQEFPQTVTDHIHSGKSSKNTADNHHSSNKSEERSSQKCSSRKIEHGLKRIIKQAQFPDSKLVSNNQKKTSTIRNQSKDENPKDKSASLKKPSKTSDQSSSNIQTRRRLQSLYSPLVVLNDGEQVNSIHPQNTLMDSSKSIPEEATGASSEIRKCQILDSKTEDVKITNKQDSKMQEAATEPQNSSDSVNSCQEEPQHQPTDGAAKTNSRSNETKVLKRGRPPSKTSKKKTVDIPKKKTKTSCHTTKAKSIKDDFTNPDKRSQASNFQSNQLITENTLSGNLPKNDTGSQSVTQSKNLVQESKKGTSSLKVHSSNLEIEKKKTNGEMTSFKVFQSLADVKIVNKSCPPTVKQHSVLSFANNGRLCHLKKLLGNYSSTFKLKTFKNYAVEKQKLENIVLSQIFSRMSSTKLFQNNVPQMQQILQRTFNVEVKKSFFMGRYFRRMSQPNHIPFKFKPIVHKKHQNNVMQVVTVPDPLNGVWVSRVSDLFNEPLTDMCLGESLDYSEMDSMSILPEVLSEYDDISTSGLLKDVLFGRNTNHNLPEPSDGSVMEKMDDLRLQIDIGETLFSTQLNYDDGLNFESIFDNEDDDFSSDRDSQLDFIMDSIEMYDAVQDSSNLAISNEDKNFHQVTVPLESPGPQNFTFSKETNNKKHSHDTSNVQSPCSSGASSPSLYGYSEQNSEMVMSLQQHLQTIVEVDEKPKHVEHQSDEDLEFNLSLPDLIGYPWKGENDRPLEEIIHEPSDTLSIQNSFRKVGLFLELDPPYEFDHVGLKNIRRMEEIPSPVEDVRLFDPFGVKSFVQEYQRAYPVKLETLPNPPVFKEETEQSASLKDTKSCPVQGESGICIEVSPSSSQNFKAEEKTSKLSDDLTISSIVEKVRISKAQRKRSRDECTFNPTNIFGGAPDSEPKRSKILRNVNSSCSRRQSIASIEDSTSVFLSENIKTGNLKLFSNRRKSAKAKTKAGRGRFRSSVPKTPKVLTSKSKQKSSSKCGTVYTKQKRSKSLGNSFVDMKKASHSVEARGCKRNRHKRTKSCEAKADTTISTGKKPNWFNKLKSSTILPGARSTRTKHDDIQDDLNSDTSTYLFDEPDENDKRESLYKVECRFCEEVFMEEETLRNHSKHHHGTEEVWKNVICLYCSKVFGRKYRFHCHLMTEHSDEDWERHPCPYCHREFPASYRLQRHIREHISQNKVTSYMCLLCSDMLTQLDSDLLIHFETKHVEFHEKLMKQYHSYQHVQDELEIFVCRYCGVFGLSLLEFKQHVQDSHKSYLAQFETDEIKDSFVSEILEMDKLTIFSENCYLCIYCSKKIDSIEETNGHIIGHHSQMIQNPQDDHYYCNFCNFSTATPYKMKKHIGKKHWYLESLIAKSAVMEVKIEKFE